MFRLLPVIGCDDKPKMIHGTNERIGVDSLELAVRYFVQLIRNTDRLGTGAVSVP